MVVVLCSVDIRESGADFKVSTNSVKPGGRFDFSNIARFYLLSLGRMADFESENVTIGSDFTVFWFIKMFDTSPLSAVCRHNNNIHYSSASYRVFLIESIRSYGADK